VIFIRYEKSDLDKIIENIIKVLEDVNFKESHEFVTISKDKITIKNL